MYLREAESRWLDPDSVYRRMSAQCRCKACHETYPLDEILHLGKISVCADCAEEETYSYDAFPEYEEEHYICESCGEPCEEQVTLIGSHPFCKECVKEADHERSFA